jgi:hypothetical protein
MNQAWKRYDELEPTGAIRSTLGAVFTVHAAALILAMHGTLLRLGHDASDLCTQISCRLDLPQVEDWGEHLEPSGTVASGAQRCDFHWHPRNEPGGPTIVVQNCFGGTN